jgi:signal peptidase I
MSLILFNTPLVLAFVLVLMYIFIDNPLQPKRWRQWRRKLKESQQEKEQSRRVRQGPVRYWIYFVGSIALFLFFFRAMVAEAYRIPTGSMEKTLLVGDFLLVDKFVYGMKTPDWIGIPFSEFGTDIPFLQLPSINEPESGDVVVFKYPLEPDVNYIKRLVATPGQEIVIRNKQVFLDGEEFLPYPEQQFAQRQILPANYRDSMIWPNGIGWNKDQWGPAIVPAKGMTIELTAKNWNLYQRAIQLEGHEVVPFQKGKFKIDGEVVSSYTFEQDHYFMMGDNRDRSSDSRYWGFMPRANVIGKAWVIYFSFDKFKIKEEFWNVIRWSRMLNVIH